MRSNICSLILLGAAFFAPKAHAAPVTFAQFTQSSSANGFTWTNNGIAGAGANGMLGTIAGGVAVNFEFLIPVAGAGGTQAAKLTITSSGTNATATTFAGPPKAYFQPSGTITIAIIRISDGKNLLTAVASESLLSGVKKGGSATVGASDDDSDVVSFTSDFLTFPALESDALSLSFSSVLPSIGLNANNLLNSFTAAGTGTFSSDLPDTHAPEPATWAMAGVTLLCGVISRRATRGKS